MKKLIFLQLAVLFLLAGLNVNCNRKNAEEVSRQDKIVLQSSPDLYELTREWAAVFCKLNPEVDIEVIQTTESVIAENLDKTKHLSFVTSQFESEIHKRSLWKLILGRNLIVPVVNEPYPYIYAVSYAPPVKESELDFLNWIIGRGHVLLDNHGYNKLLEAEQIAQVKIITGIRDGQGTQGVNNSPKESRFITRSLPYMLASYFFLLVILSLVYGIQDRRKKGVPAQDSIHPDIPFNEDLVVVQPGLYYDKTHTWAYMEKDGTVRVGINDFLQKVTGPLTRVKMLSPGEAVKKGRKAVSIIQDGKQLDICAPVSGTIKEFNKRLSKDSSLLNSSPYAEGWIYKIEPANWFQEVQFLIMGNTYRPWLKKEIERLKEFFTESLRTENTGYAHVLQDGGELTHNILKDLGPELWEDFQTYFLDVS